jgi:hypothetical protein
MQDIKIVPYLKIENQEYTDAAIDINANCFNRNYPLQYK